MLCGNHLKRNEWLTLFTFKQGPFILVKIPQRNGVSGKNGFKTLVLSPSYDIHTYTTKQLRLHVELPQERLMLVKEGSLPKAEFILRINGIKVYCQLSVKELLILLYSFVSNSYHGKQVALFSLLP